MKSDTASATLLIAGSLALTLVMVFHPTGGDLITGANPSGQAHLAVGVHALAIAAVPALFLGLLGVSRRLAPSDMSIAALVAFGLAGIGAVSAAVMSGFVAPEFIERLLAADETSTGLYHELLAFSGAANQGFAKVHVVASSVAILLWSIAILQSGRLARAAGVAGAIISAVTLLAFFGGHLQLDVHGFGLVVFTQSVWMIWLGILLLRGSREPTAD